MQSAFQNMINMQVQWLFLHQQDSFDDKNLVASLREYPLHIYLIGKTPIIKLDPSLTNITRESIDLTFYSTIKGIRKDIGISVINDQDIVRIESDYPHNFVKAYNSKNQEISFAKTGLLLKLLAADRNLYYDEFNLEVLYVGQAFGKDGNRITVDRLKSHDKAQRIYFDTQQKFPDYEIWFVAMTFKPLLMTMFKPWGDVDKSNFEKELEEQQKLEETPISFDQRITLAEAALIRYFNTSQYNKEYLDFPSAEHRSYEEVYKLDFNSVGFELSSPSLHVKLWSESVAPSFFHHESYFLHDNTERKSMLKWYE